MTNQKLKVEVTVTGTGDDATYVFSGDHTSCDGTIDYKQVIGDVEIDFSVQSSDDKKSIEFYVVPATDSALYIDGHGANGLNGQFKDYKKSKPKKLSIIDNNNDGQDHEYSLWFTDGVTPWKKDPKIKNNSIS